MSLENDIILARFSRTGVIVHSFFTHLEQFRNVQPLPTGLE